MLSDPASPRINAPPTGSSSADSPGGSGCLQVPPLVSCFLSVPSVYFPHTAKGKSLPRIKSPGSFPWLRIRSKHLAHNALRGRSLPASPMPSPVSLPSSHAEPRHEHTKHVLTPGPLHWQFLPLQLPLPTRVLFAWLTPPLPSWDTSLNTPTPLSWHLLMAPCTLSLPSLNCQLPENTQQPLCLLLQQEHLGPGLAHSRCSVQAEPSSSRRGWCLELQTFCRPVLC